jgi:hypothetical protein
VRTWLTAPLALACVLMLSACQVLSGLEKLDVGPTPEVAGGSAQVGVTGTAAASGGGASGLQAVEVGGARAAASGGASGFARGGADAAQDQSVAGDGAATAAIGGAGATERNSTARGDMGGHSAPPAADGGSGAESPMPAVPPSSLPQASDKPDSWNEAGAPSPPQGGAQAPATDPSRAGAAAQSGGDGGSHDTAVCVPPALGGALCDTAPQCGCGPNQKCIFYRDQLSCVPAGTADLDQACSTIADCLPGLQCLGGACLRLCDPARSDCGTKACQQATSSLGGLLPGSYFCVSDCNLVDPQKPRGDLVACGPGMHCIWITTGSVCGGSEYATRGHGEVCSTAYDCKPGFVCRTDNICGKWCETSSDCPSDFSCDIQGEISVGAVKFGTCVPNCRDAQSTCAVNPQCGCDAAQACDFVSDAKNGRVRSCRAVGATPAYSPCTYHPECGAGSSCVDSYCSPFCKTDSECGDRYASCAQVYNYDLPGRPAVPGFVTCERPCDPADPYRGHGSYAPCAAGRACMAEADGRSYCHDTNPRGAVGVSCATQEACAPGNACVDTAGCAKLCRYDADCPTGNVCSHFEPRHYATTVEWGYCSVRQ